MRLVWLEFLLHDDALLQKLRHPGHDQRVEHVYLEIEAITNMEAIERDAFDQRDPGDEFGLFAVHIAPVAHGERVVNGEMKAVDVCPNYTSKQSVINRFTVQ